MSSKAGALTPEQAAEATSLYQQGGWSQKAIAARLGLPRWRVAYCLRAAGVCRPDPHNRALPPLSVELRTAAIRLRRDEHLAYTHIAAQLGAPKASIYALLQEAGLIGQPKPPAACLTDQHRSQIPQALHLAAATVSRLRLPHLPEADLDDFGQVARLAALVAVTTYSTAKGASLSTWIVSKVRWALLEELRHLDPLSRLHRRQLEEEAEDRRQIQQNAADREKSPAASDALPLPSPDRPGAARARSEPVLVPIHLLESPVEGKIYHVGSYPNFCRDIDAELLSVSVRQAFRRLRVREQFVLRRSLEGYTYPEIGRMLSISTSRVKQLADEGRTRLRQQLAAALEDET